MKLAYHACPSNACRQFAHEAEDAVQQVWAGGLIGVETFSQPRHDRRTDDRRIRDSGDGRRLIRRANAESNRDRQTRMLPQPGHRPLDRIARVPVGGPTNSLPLQPVVLYQAIVLPVLKK